MGTEELQHTLRNLAGIGTLVRDSSDCQLWHFVHQERAYLLRFFPRWSGGRLNRLLRGSPAMGEFQRLQMLQKAAIPSPRAVAVMMGFQLAGRSGDAVIFEAIEPAVPLDEYLNNLELAGEAIPRHLDLARQVRTLVHSLGRAKLGHDDLSAGSFLVHGERLYLSNAGGVRAGGLKWADVLRLGAGFDRYATRSDLQRGWELLGAGDAMPAANPAAARRRRRVIRSTRGENGNFGRLRSAGWSGMFFKQFEHPYRWSAASRLTIREADWQRAWPLLLGQIESDQLTILKRDAGGDVLEGEVVLGGRPMAVVIKRPRRKHWWRYFNEIGRGVRARRAWTKSWWLIARHIATAWPLLVMQRRVLGYTTDAMVVVEKIPGPTLATIDLAQLSPAGRATLFHRAGAILRRMESIGLYHWDAKATNWIVRMDEKSGPSPLLVDVDGIRQIRWMRSGIARLLRSMKQHAQYTPEDSLALCRGYSPWAAISEEEAIGSAMPT